MSTANQEILELLFANGADINGKYNPNGNTLLHEAINGTDPSEYKSFFKGLFTYLIRKGADVNARNDQGYGPLHIAVEKGSCHRNRP